MPERGKSPLVLFSELLLVAQMSSHRRKSVVLKAGWIAESVTRARQTGYTRFCWPAYQYRNRV
jgi:hypothetical protein